MTNQSAPIRADGIDLARLAEAVSQGQTGASEIDESQRFWASNSREISSDRRDVLTVSFGSHRLVNQLSFKVSRFPLVLRVEYLSESGSWQPFSHVRPRRSGKPRREIKTDPVRLVIAESVPAKVDSAQAAAHPQHFGKAHWFDESWKVVPVRTRKIRFVFTRNHRGTPPKNPNGNAVPYSVAVKNLAIGYRVHHEEDIPSHSEGEWWATGKDILGSQVSYSTYRQPASSLIDGELSTYWRSAPQPFPFAVESVFLDVRDIDGTAPLIDRFWLDPVTTGVMLNIYYSHTLPEGDFDGESSSIPLQFFTPAIGPVPIRGGEANEIRSLNLGPVERAGAEISNTYLRIDYSQAWWAGIDAASLAATADAGPRPILSVGLTQILQDGASLKVMAQSGEAAVITLDPSQHTINSTYRLVVAYYPDDAVDSRPAHFRIVYQLGSHAPVSNEYAVDPLEEQNVPVKVGLHPDPNNTDSPAVAIKGLVVKSEILTEETEEWFLDEGEEYVSDADSVHLERRTAQNARLRMHPAFANEANPFGLVGGSGNRYAEMEWTPVLRDYTLRRGYMKVQPTRAAFWKFEMTGLLPEVYENFLSIEKDVQVFPPDVIATYEAIAGKADNRSTPAGVETIANISPDVAYSDVLNAVRSAGDAPEDATQVLVVSDPVRARQVATSGWVWTYQPWHTGASAPKFIGTRQHRYESIRVKHSTKVAFFAAIREIMPFRVDYSFDDDTPEYVEHLLDQSFIDMDLTKSVEFIPEGGIRSLTASGAEIVSEALLSYREVRGVQFATQETDAVQVLADPDFRGSDLSKWKPYGDATLTWLGINDLLVTRGWFGNTYGDLEEAYDNYGQMDGVLYSALEGNNQPSGYAEGGASSEPYTPSGAGKVTAIVQISGVGTMDAPISLDIVSSFDDRVLATGSRWIRGGETQEIKVGYTPGSLADFRTYGDVETMVSTPTTYGELEIFKYYEIEAESGLSTDLYIRVRQQGPTDDSFHINRLSLYDSPVAWYFSNDDGATWWQAIDVRNDPFAVLTFPESDNVGLPGVGRTLRWKAVLFRENAVINALHVRPWYGTRARTVDRSHGLEGIGPNRSTYDVFPATHQHPMWQDLFNPLESFYEEPEVDIFWRNLVPNPSGEGPYLDQWEVLAPPPPMEPPLEPPPVTMRVWDDFNRTDLAPGAYDDATGGRAPWVLGPPNPETAVGFSIVEGVLYPAVGSAGELLTVEGNISDGKLSTTRVGGDIANQNDDRIVWRVSADGKRGFYMTVGGSIGYFDTDLHVVGDGDFNGGGQVLGTAGVALVGVVSIVLDGPNMTVYSNGGLQGSTIVDTRNQTETRYGFGTSDYTPGTRGWDDFEITEVV